METLLGAADGRRVRRELAMADGKPLDDGPWDEGLFCRRDMLEGDLEGVRSGPDAAAGRVVAKLEGEG